MRLDRHYTREGQDVFALIETKTISIEICHEDSQRRLCIPNFEAPAHWSKRAAEHLAVHYARRTGVPAAILRIAESGVPEWLWRSEPHLMQLETMAEPLRYGSETSYKQIVHRLVGAWSYWGWANGYFDTEADVRAFYDEMAHLIIMQQAMPASPQWLNTGLHWAYGISGDAQGCMYVDAASGELMTAASAFERPQHHHCFIQSVRDDLSGEGGITDLWQREMRVFRNGSGSGCNMSDIRSETETLSSGLRPAGLVPFMDISEKSAQILASAGDRSAVRSKLSLIDCDHPDLQRVLSWRREEHRERIAKAIGAAKQQDLFQKLHSAIRHFTGTDAQRYHPAINTALRDVLSAAKLDASASALVMHYLEELQSCSGESRLLADSVLAPAPEPLAQRSVSQLGFRLSDSFMRAASSNAPWAFRRRTDNTESTTQSASALLDELAHLNWLTGDGLMQFSDSIEFWNGCKTAAPIRASSPSGEFLFLSDSACDVAVINLAQYLTEAGGFDIAAFEHTVRLQTIMCDIAITMAQFPSAEVAYNSYRYRPIGLSYCNLAALLMAMGYAYDSDEARAIAAAITALMTGRGYVTSAEIARELGGFEAFSEVRDSMMQLMWQHHEAAFGRTQHLGNADICPLVIDHSDLPDSDLSEAVQKTWDLAMIHGDEFGYSNAQISLIAASPNVLILMDALTSGAMPLSCFDHRESGAHIMASGLEKLGYKPDQVAMILRYVFGHHTLFGAQGINHQALRVRNFTETEVSLVEEALQKGQSLHMAFDPLHLGERFCRETLALSDAQLYDANFSLLHHLGFDEEALAAFERHIAGHGSVEGAPFLRPEDYAIFALANPACQHAISVEAQIRMNASLQAYLSGGIAHTILTPASASVKDHRRWLMMAWQMGMKHLELQRQQNTPAALDLPQETAQIQEAFSPFVATVASQASEVSALPKFAIHAAEVVGMIKLQIAELMQSLPAASTEPHQTQAQTEASPAAPAAFTASASQHMPEAPAAHRAEPRALPARRKGYVQEAEIGGVLVRHRVEEYEDGSLGVIHLELPDCEVNLQQALQQSAKLLSIALQHGVPIEAFEALACEVAYCPQGEVSGHAEIMQAQSVMDYLLQDVLPHYQQQLCNLSAKAMPQNTAYANPAARDIMQLGSATQALSADNNPLAMMDSALLSS